jgi:hypothetical protein
MNKSELIKSAVNIGLFSRNAKAMRGLASYVGKKNVPTALKSLETEAAALKALPKGHPDRNEAANFMKHLRKEPAATNQAPKVGSGTTKPKGFANPKTQSPVAQRLQGPGLTQSAKARNAKIEQFGEEKPSFLSRLGEFMKRPGVAPTAAGVGAGTGGYLLGSGLGESRGRESGQVMGAYEGYMRAMQEAQQRYNDQGIIDRILGNSPF